MGSKVLLVLGLLAVTVLFAPTVAAVRSVETTATPTYGKPDGQVAQDSCYYCGYISSGYCQCCVSSAKAAQKDGAAVSLVETAATTMAIGGDASCYYCGYISYGYCRCCASSGKAAQKVAGVKP